MANGRSTLTSQTSQRIRRKVLFLLSDVNIWNALTEAAQANDGAGDFSLVKTSHLFDQGEWSNLFQRALLGFDGLTVVKTKTTDHNR